MDLEAIRNDVEGGLEAPLVRHNEGGLYQSDVLAETLRALDVPYVALNPGSSYRGLHDSIVNHLGNDRPRMLLCLHEEHAVSIAQGYAKVTGKPMAVALHSNVGLMHASMSIYNAWCDRVPMLILGGTGAVDAAKRRPWVEWLHTSRDQAALVRDYVKWDDQPASLAAARESILRGAWLTSAAPRAPVYIVLDLEMQERPLAVELPAIRLDRYRTSVKSGADQADIAAAADLLRKAKRPLILCGRVSRSLDGWHDRVRLAEAVGATVVTDNRIACSFPTDHPLHLAVLRSGLTGTVPVVAEAIRQADVILSLDWLDLAGSMQMAAGGTDVPATVIQVSMDHYLHNGWSFDHMGLPAIDLMIAAEPEPVVARLVAHLGAAAGAGGARPIPLPEPALPPGPVATPQLAYALRQVLAGRPASLLQLPSSWDARSWHLTHPLDYLGMDGAGGLGSGPGIAVGAALALRDGDRVPVAVIGDGNFIMGSSAIWTAVHYRIPLLVIVANNQSFFNDEIHQEITARHRGRAVENKWIGMRMSDPEIDVAAVARAQGAVGLGPVNSAHELVATLEEALRAFDEGRTVVVDVRVLPGHAQ